MPPRPPDLLDAIAREPALAVKLRAVAAGGGAVFAHVVENAHAALCGVLARICEKPARSLWLVCGNVRAQEQFHNELSQWFADADFFPELEAAPPLMLCSFILACVVYRELLTRLVERPGTWLGAALGHAIPNLAFTALAAAGLVILTRPEAWPLFPAPGGLAFSALALIAVFLLRRAPDPLRAPQL